MTDICVDDEQKRRLIERVEGLPFRLEPQRPTLPLCFGNPDISSGVCNQILPLRSDEPCECALARSCLVARLLKDDSNLDLSLVEAMPYEAILTLADNVWAALEAAKREDSDRQRLRSQVASMRLSLPKNPYRAGSLRHFIIDTLSTDWISMTDLAAKVAVSVPQAKNVDLVMNYVTSISSQETGAYRIVEASGLYRCYAR